MLKDTLLQWCEQKYDPSLSGHCDPHCSNRDNCKGDCDKCLDQVHWYPSSGGRSDYTCPNLLFKYVLRFTQKYSDQIALALSNIDLSLYPNYRIFSIGCGGAPDLMAFEEVVGNKRIYYKGYDRNPLWEPIHNKIEEYTGYTLGIDAKLCREDIFNVFFDGRPAHKQYNVVVIQYLLSHLYNTGEEEQTNQLFKGIIDKILSNRPKGSPFLIIITDVDSLNKGRNRWYSFLDMLEDAGYYGNAYARSAFPTGDLGRDRWSSCYHEMSSSFGNISYTYKQNASAHDGAQLVIELR